MAGFLPHQRANYSPLGRGAAAIAFTPAGDRLITRDPGVAIWDATVGKPMSGELLWRADAVSGLNDALLHDLDDLLTLALGSPYDSLTGVEPVLQMSEIDVRTVPPDRVEVSDADQKMIGNPVRFAASDGDRRQWMVSPQRSLLVSYGFHVQGGNSKGILDSWDLSTGIQRWSQRIGSSFSTLAISPDERFLVGHVYDKRTFKLTLRAWSSDTGTEIWQSTPYTFSGPAPVFTSDGRRFATGSDKRIQIWDATTWAQVHEFIGHGTGSYHTVTAMAFNADGTRLATIAQDGSALVWAVPEPEKVQVP